MFVDSVKIFVKAGNGGDGIVAFLREKYIEKGGPTGGHGGRGGNVVFIGEEGLTTLLDFRYRRKIEAFNGSKGGDKNCSGKMGESVYVKVPIGTTITNLETGRIIGDITKGGQKVIVAKGGRGGKGNAAFASPKNTTPQYAEKGLKGEAFECGLELKVLADIIEDENFYEEGISQYAGFDIVAVPTILVEKPITLVGMGDTISSISLVGAR